METIIAENINFLVSKWAGSYQKLADKLNDGQKKDDFFSKDQVYNYATEKSDVSDKFLLRLANLIGVSVKELQHRALTEKDLLNDAEENLRVSKPLVKMLQNQDEIKATQQVTLSVLSQIHGLLASQSPDTLLGSYQKMVRDQAKASRKAQSKKKE